VAASTKVMRNKLRTFQSGREKRFLPRSLSCFRLQLGQRDAHPRLCDVAPWPGELRGLAVILATHLSRWTGKLLVAFDLESGPEWERSE
jgi:hypothetical protein